MNDEIRILIEKLVGGKCTREEIQRLQLLLHPEQRESLEKVLWKDWNRLKPVEIDPSKKEEILGRIESELGPATKSYSPKRRRSKWRTSTFLKFAAILVGGFLISYFMYQEISFHEPSQYKITIELEDGTIKTINSKKIQLTSNSSLQLQKSENLIYQDAADPDQQDLEYNTVRVPYGKTLEMILSDGSVVFINSGSSLRYPVHFLKGLGREVYLKGEAYFEVSHNPGEKFIVHTEHLSTSVYGTRFNISAYPDQELTEVTLVSGSVGVNPTGGGKTQILEPDQMASFSEESLELQVKEVIAEDHIAWINGLLVFRDKTFGEILPILERKYNVQIENHFSELTGKHFTGRFRSDQEDIEDVLKTFARATEFLYKRQNDKIIINEIKTNSNP